MTVTSSTIAPMTDEDRRAISTTADFLAAAVDDPSLLDGIPSGATLVLLTGHPAADEAEIARGVAAVRAGEDVVFKHFKRAAVPA